MRKNTTIKQAALLTKTGVAVFQLDECDAADIQRVRVGVFRTATHQYNARFHSFERRDNIDPEYPDIQAVITETYFAVYKVTKRKIIK